MILNELLIARLLKFGTVGFSSVAVDFAITYLCKEKLGVQKFVASAIGFYVSVIWSFIFNRLWTFNNANPDWFLQFLQFAGVATVGLGISLGIIFLLHNKLKLNFYLAKVISIGGSLLWNFTIFQFVIFK